MIGESPYIDLLTEAYLLGLDNASRETSLHSPKAEWCRGHTNGSPPRSPLRGRPIRAGGAPGTKPSPQAAHTLPPYYEIALAEREQHARVAEGMTALPATQPTAPW